MRTGINAALVFVLATSACAEPANPRTAEMREAERLTALACDLSERGGKAPDVIRILTRSLDSAETPRAYALRSALEVAIGLIDAGCADMESALELDPAYATARAYLTAYYKMAGKDAESLRSLEALKALRPRDDKQRELFIWAADVAEGRAEPHAICRPGYLKRRAPQR